MKQEIRIEDDGDDYREESENASQRWFLNKDLNVMRSGI